MQSLIYILFLAAAVHAQTTATETAPAASERRESESLYRVTVVSRTTQAINYGHRTVPTVIDFKGTVLLPDAKGRATVKSERGSVQIDSKFENVPAPTRFGREYLTYVVWAITPEGRAENLGELVLNPSDKGRLKLSTELQAFALIVTAEPHFAVTRPSPVVVMENVIRPDTAGRVVPVTASYELLPPKNYTYDLSAATSVPETRMVSMEEYEAVLALYQAQNAIQIAKANNADAYAAGALRKAEDLYRRAHQAYTTNPKSKLVVTLAREATQSAGDANLITTRRQEQASAAEAQIK
jgi:hypothetical protein